MEPTQSIINYLDASFKSFEPGLRDRIAEAGVLKNIPAGEVIMRTGQYIKHSVLIASGRVKLYREGDDGQEVFIYYLEEGNACALSMICATKQESSEIMAKAVDDTTIIMIPIRMMDELMTTYRSWYYFVLENYRSRFEELLTVLDSVIFKAMDERLEFYLRNQFKSRGVDELSITHLEIANDLNTSREVVSRLLKKMEQNGKIRLFRNSIAWVG
ncbi:Crp/Fnr family transcriptional regulator [Dyadobacter sandarakinus]|uniref:Crp/Fnr family transcriptional regulator n=1 Tax=Dyadobacter sandarakinus TaxID=2747268 RepID=A0ABX7I685_9BACT|nr:Crp/Fnr family transcriptional regulator [Dyadobacter sandarakinus]QRR01614.1 Crp/Fnr family transcriptional regulator [Dyadobacter sandarakinus]